MVLKGTTPFEVGLILVVLLLGVIAAVIIPLPILRQQLAVTIKITYTSNEASLTLLTLLPLKYDRIHTVYYALSTYEINGLDTKAARFIKQRLKQISNVDCFNLTVDDKVILSEGGCKSFDYRAEATLFKPYGKKLTEKIMLAYEKAK